MALFNSASGYGTITKACHWAIAALFALQYVSAAVMLRTPGDGATQAELVSAADRALYHAKAQGRERVVLAGRDADRQARTA